MISNQIMQNTIEGIKAIARVELFVADIDGKLVASTKTIGNNFESSVLEFVKSPADSQEIQGCQFFKIYDDQQLEYILIANDAGENAYMVGKMAAFQLQNLMVAYKERFDKDNFIKNLLLDNLLLVDIYSRSKKLHIQTDVKRAVLIVESPNGESAMSRQDIATVLDGIMTFPLGFKQVAIHAEHIHNGTQCQTMIPRCIDPSDMSHQQSYSHGSQKATDGADPRLFG